MRSACFIDGYNLYYGLLHGTGMKWLNVRTLLQGILHEQNPNSVLEYVHYFTSPVVPRLASQGTLSLEAQQQYIRALQTTGVIVTQGKHRLDKGRAPAYVKNAPASRQNQVDVWSLEEKQTDVNIALSIYRFALKQQSIPEELRVTQLVLVSNDSDFAPALEAVKEDFPDVTLGVVAPIREVFAKDRAPSGSLSKHADWYRRMVKEGEIAKAQFPEKIPTRKKPIFKPNYW